MKRKLLIVSIVAICIAILAAGSLAYFTAEGTAHNVITTGGVEIELKEWADAEKKIPFENMTGVMPGTPVTKIVEVKNTGASDAWVRVKVEKKIEPKTEGVEIDPNLVELDLDTEKWEYKDGFYYYKEALKPNETTKPILGSVTFKPTMGNEYQNAKISVEVSAQAVQTANNGKTVTEAAGWPKP